MKVDPENAMSIPDKSSSIYVFFMIPFSISISILLSPIASLINPK